MAEKEHLETSVDRLTDDISLADDAAIGVIGIRTPLTECFKVVDIIYMFAQQKNSRFWLHMMQTGWGEYKKITEAELQNTLFKPLSPMTTDKKTLQLVSALLAITDETSVYAEEGYFVLLDAYFFLDDPGFQSLVRNQFLRSLDNDQRLFIIIPDHIDIPEGISSLIHILELDVPTYDELKDSFDDIVNQIDETLLNNYEEKEVHEIIQTAAGMTKSSFESALGLAIADASNVPEHLSEETEIEYNIDKYKPSIMLNWVTKYKTSLLKKTDILELINPIPLSDVGGLDLYKEWIISRARSYEQEAIDFGITPLKGALVVGPSGTGKSLLAKTTGAVLQLPVIKFDIGRVFNQYIGSSESAMRLVTKMIDNMAPCVVFCDEIDKGWGGVQGGNSDSGTTSRVFGTWLTWIQERDQIHKPICLILTANRVENLPAELMRKGRLDEIWHVGYPNKEERKEIIRIHTKKRGHGDALTEKEISQLATDTKNYVGAELEALIEGGLNYDFGVNDKLTLASIMKEHAVLKPLHLSFKDQMAHMEKWAKNNARPASSEDETSKQRIRRIKGSGRRIIKAGRRDDG